MQMSKVCDRCAGHPLPFEVGSDDNNGYEEAYYFIVPKDLKDPNVLMSSGETMFKVAVIQEHPILEDERFLCGDCFDELFEPDED